jgi:hypothetical protein
MPTIFSIEPRATSPTPMSYGYRTNVLEAYSGMEQRIRLRQTPRLALEYDYMTVSARQTGLLQALIASEQANEVVLPLWHWTNPLTSGIGAGATVLPVSTVDIPWLGYWVQWLNYAVLWRDPFTCELVNVTDAWSSTTQITISPGTVSAWPAGTQVIPAVLANFDGAPPVVGTTLEHATGRARFRMKSAL